MILAPEELTCYRGKCTYKKKNPSLLWYMCVCIHICMYMYVYIYIYRYKCSESERKFVTEFTGKGFMGVFDVGL